MKTLILTIALTAALLAQPNQLDLRQDPPTAVQSERVSSAYTGTSGATTYYYWVVTRYPIGFIVPTSPVVVGGASALGGGNSVALAWPAMTGASSYDVLRTTTNAAPSSCTCAVVLATTGTTLTDNGAALSVWPPGGLNSAGVAQAEFQINNRDAGAPYITMAVRNAQRTLNYQLGILKNGTAPSYVPSGFIQPYSNAQGAMACVDSTGADCMATRPGPTNFCSDAGSTDAYACSLSPAISSYAVGNSYRFKANTPNTGAATLNLNSLGAVAIKTAAGADLATGDIRANQMVDVVYTVGGTMQMSSASGNVVTGVNVEDFGAVGDGSTDDTTTFQAAATAASGGTLIIPPAAVCYKVTAITIPANTTVLGSSGGAVCSGYAVGITGAPALFNLGGNVVIDGVAFTNSVTPTGASNYVVAVSTNSTANNTITRSVFSGSFGQALLIYGGSKNFVANNTFSGIGIGSTTTPGDAVNIYKSVDNIVYGNQFLNNQQDAIYINGDVTVAAARNTITANAITGSPEGIQCVAYCVNNTITSNVISITPSATITSFAIIFQGISGAAASGATDNITQGNTFTIVSNGQTMIGFISIDAYSHRNLINGNTFTGLAPTADVASAAVSVTTTGGAGTESLDTSITNNIFRSINLASIYVAADHDGFLVSNNKVSLGGNVAITVEADNGTISGNVVKGNGGFYGIKCLCSGSVITSNNVQSVGALSGIMLTGSGNTVTGNTAIGNNTYGIEEAATSDYNTIIGNNVRANSHASSDIIYSGANTKVCGNIGRYTPTSCDN